jgi:transposase-like protein
MARYEQSYKNSIVKKILLPDGPGISTISEETGISMPTLYSWVRKLRQDVEMEAQGNNPNDRSIIEKQDILLEAAGIPPEGLGAFLRERGIHEEHLKLWRNEIRAMLKKNSSDMRHELGEAKKKNQELERELKRKEKALAELSTLLVIKKKWDHILNPKEDA